MNVTVSVMGSSNSSTQTRRERLRVTRALEDKDAKRLLLNLMGGSGVCRPKFDFTVQEVDRTSIWIIVENRRLNKKTLGQLEAFIEEAFGALPSPPRR